MAYGFRPVTVNGSAYQTGGFQEFPINPSEATRISNGDLCTLTDDYGVIVNGGVPTPLIVTAGSGGNTLPTFQALGVFVGCRYVDTNGTPTWNQYWPAAAGTEAFAFVVTDPLAVYKIQSSAEWVETALGNTVNPTLTAGADSDGNSRAVVGALTDVANACLRIVGVVRDGSDITSTDATPDILVQWSSPTCLLSGYQTAVA